MTSATKTVKAANLKPGMRLVNPETGLADFEIDHRVSAARNSGAISFFGLDSTTRSYVTMSFRPSLVLQVEA